MTVCKETKEVTVFITGPRTIQIPSFKFSLHQLKLMGVFLLSGLLFLTLTSTEDTIPNLVEPIQPIEVTKGIVEVCGLERPDMFFKRDTQPVDVKVSGKVIPITKIISDKDVLEFICHNQILERAFGVQEKTGLSVASIVVQKGLESRWGKSSLCALTKNLGNIKCFNKKCKKNNVRLSKKGQIGNQSSHCVQLWDDSPSDRYIRFETYAAGWNKYCELIEKRFKKAANKSTMEEEIKALKAGGYATDPNYAPKLIKLAKQKNITGLQDYINQGYSITSESGQYTFLKQ